MIPNRFTVLLRVFCSFLTTVVRNAKTAAVRMIARRKAVNRAVGDPGRQATPGEGHVRSSPNPPCFALEILPTYRTQRRSASPHC
jgi:hypothetical protein